MDDLARLISVEEIKALKARYFRGIDEKNRPLLESLFTDDVTLDYRGAATDPSSGVNAMPEATEAVLHGLKPSVDAMMRSIEGVVSVHHGMMPEIEITSERTAKAIWPMTDRLKFTGGGAVAELTGHGHYHETYERISRDWKIKTLKLTRFRVDIVLA